MITMTVPFAGDLARLMISKEHEFEYWQRYSRQSLFEQVL